MKRHKTFDNFLVNGGKMGEYIMAKNWQNHPLGPINTWPQSLVSTLNICLQSNFPMCIYWSTDLYLFYNDAWSSIPNIKHPEDALGKTANQVWGRIWRNIEKPLRELLVNGEGVLIKDRLYIDRQNNKLFERYLDHSFSPIFGEDGKVAGLFNTSNDVTARIFAERRNTLLRKLSEHFLEVESPEAASIFCANVLSENPFDTPFAVLYLLSQDGSTFKKISSTSDISNTIAPPLIDPSLNYVLDYKKVATSKEPLHVKNIDHRHQLPSGPWKESATSLVILPILKHGTKELQGVVVAGISPRISYDHVYADYYAQVADLVSVSVSNGYSQQRKLKLEAREREAQTRLQTALSTGAIGIWTWDIKKNVVVADKNLAYRFGVDTKTAEEGLPISVFTNSIHPDDREWVINEIQYSVRDSKVFEAEYRTLTRDGAVRWVMARGKVEDDENGEPSRFPGVIVDITDRKEIERKLIKSERMFNALFESSIMGVAVATLDGKVHEANQTFLEMFGYTEQDLAEGLYSYMITPTESKGVTSIIYQELREKGEVEPIEKDYIRKDGTIIPVLVGAVMITGSSDRFISFMLDISEQAQLRALNDAKDEFISIASHQLRTPATGVKQYLGMILEGYVGELNDDQKKMLRTAYESNERQLTIVNDLLRVAQADADEITLHVKKVNIVQLIQAVIEEQTPRFTASRQKILFTKRAPTTQVAVDPLQIRMVLENLIDNAHKYMPKGKTLHIRLNSSKTLVKITVRDEGVGIKKQDMPKLFKKFSRIENPLSTASGGTGLGLYWVSKIIALHHGNITVNSTYRKGTEFVITIPADITKEAG